METTELEEQQDDLIGDMANWMDDHHRHPDCFVLDVDTSKSCEFKVLINRMRTLRAGKLPEPVAYDPACAICTQGYVRTGQGPKPCKSCSTLQFVPVVGDEQEGLPMWHPSYSPPVMARPVRCMTASYGEQCHLDATHEGDHDFNYPPVDFSSRCTNEGWGMRCRLPANHAEIHKYQGYQ